MLSDLDYHIVPPGERLRSPQSERAAADVLPAIEHGQAVFVMDTRRDFVFIDDLVDVVIKAIDGAGRRGAYHVSSGFDYGIKELLRRGGSRDGPSGYSR